MQGAPSNAAIRPPFTIEVDAVQQFPLKLLRAALVSVAAGVVEKRQSVRSIASDELLVCSVENTRCPVSAAVIAVDIVSRSRISPTSITSGSCRSAALRAAAYECILSNLSLCHL